MSDNDVVFKYEAIGDWSGLKGSQYHIVYAVYLLLVELRTIQFYAGNDLLAFPPVEVEIEQPISGCTSSPTRDDWLQFKNVSQKSPWTLNKIRTDKTLVHNFVVNALMSEHRGRDWSVTLATPALIRKDDICKFAEDIQNSPPKQRNQFDKIVTNAHKDWTSRDSAGSVSVEHVRELAVKVLEQIAHSEPVSLRLLTDSIEKEVLKIYPDEVTMKKVVLALTGAMQEVGSADKAQPTAFSLSWLEQRTGYTLVPHDLIPRDCIAACQCQTERARPDGWSKAFYVPRSNIEKAFRDFRNSDRCLFVLVGDSGAGKSWAVAGNASSSLQGRVRCLLPGSLLLSGVSLAAMVAGKFRDIAQPDLSDEAIIRNLHAAAADADRGPFTVFFDDVPLSAKPIEIEAHIESLCQEAINRHIKLVLVARRGVWDLISRGHKVAPFLFRRVPLGEAVPLHSYDLSNLSHEELGKILARRLPASANPAKLALKLRHPSFTALQNAYLLSIFIRQIEDSELTGQKLASVDTLLDSEIRNRKSAVASLSGCEVNEASAAFQALVSEMWDQRRTGMQGSALVTLFCAATPDKGRDLLHAMQQGDILTPSGSRGLEADRVTYANPQFGERLTALWLSESLSSGVDVLGMMEPGLDDGVMAALVRKAIDNAVADPWSWAEEVLRRDARWLPALCQGLAQRHENEWKTVGILCAWSNHSELLAMWNAMRALGGMAAWSPCARFMLASLYSDEEPLQSFKGEMAMGFALELVPGWVKRRILVRLRQIVAEPVEFNTAEGSKRRAKEMSGALRPLRYANHRESAVIAENLLNWVKERYRHRVPQQHADVRERFDETVDIIRGNIAVYGEEESFSQLVSELDAPDILMQRRAARTLLPISQHQPDRIRDVLFAHAIQEQDPGVQVHLLHSLTFYTETDSNKILQVIHQTGALDNAGCGLALLLLAKIARRSPSLEAFLPQCLAGVSAATAAILDELLSYTWWQYAAATGDKQAWQVLDTLSTPDYQNLPDEYRTFVARATAVATLALIAHDIPDLSEAAQEVQIWFYSLSLELYQPILHLDLTPLLRQFLSQIVTHQLYPRLLELLCETLNQFQDHRIHPVRQPENDWQSTAARGCADWLSTLVCGMDDDPIPLIEKVPDWAKIRICTGLLDAGRASDRIVEFGTKICADHLNEGSDITPYLEEFLSRLNAQGRLPNICKGYLNRDLPIGDAGAARVQAEMEANTGSILDLLHENVSPVTPVPFLWYLSPKSRDWRIVLLGQVFRTMFSARPFGAKQCSLLCDQVLAAIDGLPDSPLSEQYREVYQTLKNFANGTNVEVPTMEFSDDLLSQSHKLAMEIVTQFQNSGSMDVRVVLENRLMEGAGWIEDQSHKVNHGTVSWGTVSSIYIPPALRIALAVVSERCGIEDFGIQWAKQRADVQQAFRSGDCYHVFGGAIDQFSDAIRSRYLRGALVQLERQIRRTPREAVLHWRKGHVLLLRGRYAEARQSLEQCLRLPSYQRFLAGSTEYEMACVSARLGESDRCHHELAEAVSKMQNVQRQHVAADPDFESVRAEPWFQNILSTLPVGTKLSFPRPSIPSLPNTPQTGT